MPPPKNPKVTKTRRGSVIPAKGLVTCQISFMLPTSLIRCSFWEENFASGCTKLFHLLRPPTADWTHLPDQSIGRRGSWPRLDNASVGVVISIEMLYQEGLSTLKPLGEYWVNTDIPHVQNTRVKDKL